MSGDIHELTEIAASVFDANERENFRSILQVILQNQFLTDQALSGVWQVVKGTGMRLVCSGEIADVCFWKMCEAEFLCKATVKEKYQIAGFWRFKDDIIVGIAGDSTSRLHFAKELRKRSRFYRLEFELCKTTANFLDLSLTIESNGSITWTRFQKPTSLWQPLSPLSGHPRSVHQAWPAGVLRRIKRHCKFVHDQNYHTRSFCGSS